MVFDPVWASDPTAEIDVPTDAEMRLGFICGPASPGRFNWLFQVLMSAVNAFNVGEFAPRTRQIATTEGLQGGGTLENDRTLRLDFDGLEAETVIANDDYVAIFDQSSGAHRKMTREDFVAGLGGEGGTLTGAANVGGGPGQIYAGTTSGSLQMRTLIDGGGLTISVASNTVVVALADMSADLTFA